MRSLNDIILQIHMTFLNHKNSLEWVSSFKDEISPLSQEDFNTLIGMLEGVAQEEQNNYMESLQNNKIPMHLQMKATLPDQLYNVIDLLKRLYLDWKKEG